MEIAKNQRERVCIVRSVAIRPGRSCHSRSNFECKFCFWKTERWRYDHSYSYRARVLTGCVLRTLLFDGSALPGLSCKLPFYESGNNLSSVFKASQEPVNIIYYVSVNKLQRTPEITAKCSHLLFIRPNKRKIPFHQETETCCK